MVSMILLEAHEKRRKIVISACGHEAQSELRSCIRSGWCVRCAVNEARFKLSSSYVNEFYTPFAVQ